MAEFVVSFVLERIRNMLIRGANSLHGVRGQVEQMQTELKLVRGFLQDADKMQDEDEAVRVWVSEIKKATYDAEDVIETFALKIASRRRGGIQNTIKRSVSIINEPTEIREVCSEIEAIKTRISKLRTDLQTYGIKPKSKGEGSSSAHGTQQHGWRRSYPYVVEEYTVGLDGDVENLVRQLVGEEKHCRVVSICGMGGLGKTTLAKQVYHHSYIRRHFDGFAWACISQQCQPRDVWEGILFQLTSPSKMHIEEIKRLRDEALTEKLHQVQLDKRCLVILDDIWSIKAWDSLSHAFPVGNGPGKMLLTTRNKAVARHVDSSGFLHEPRCLTKAESLELFLKKAFPGKDDPGFRIDTNMAELGDQMVERCEGLPLAIVVLGGLLATKHTLNEWYKVRENINSYLRRGKGHEQQSGVTEVLALSYHELPYQLKPCFLHLGHFPDDFDIPTKKLVRMWVAEGIVFPMQCDIEGEETLEDVAERYLGELIDRCMVQVGVRGSTGRVKTCRLHNLMRDLCVLEANRENFLKIIDQDGNERMVGIVESSHRIRRLAIYLSGAYGEIVFGEHEKTPYLRSLLFFCTHNVSTRISQKMISGFSIFKLLRILDLERCHIEERLPRRIGNLIHLKYLSLNCDRITVIPSSIGNLRCLQTLILKAMQPLLLGVPNVIWKMEQLRHLYLPMFNLKSSRNKLRLGNLKSSGKLRLGNLGDLQTLHGFDAERCDVKELIKLTNLKKLGISDLGSFKELEGILITLNRLCCLKISVNSTVEEIDLQRLVSGCHRLYKLSLFGLIEKLPEYHQFCPNLTKLTFGYSKLEEDPMATLEKLPNLSILRLIRGAFIGREMVCSSKGFPQLKSLVLNFLPYLEKWRVDEEAMPNLCGLVIEGCKELKTVPAGLSFITTLQKLQIVDMPIVFENRLQMETGEDFDKVQHVPSIIFRR